MKHKTVIMLALALVLVLGITLLASGQTLMQQMGDADRQAENIADMTVIATIQGEEYAINSGHLENAYSYYQKTPETMNETEVKEFYVANELLYREARSQGFDAGPEEVDKHIAYLKDVMKDDPEGYLEFCDYLKGRGMTEEEYWKDSWDEYQEELTIEKLGEKLSDEFYAQHPGATAKDYDEYYRSEYRPALFEKYQVKML